MAEYGAGRPTSSRDALSATAIRYIDEYFSLFAASSIFHLIYFVHQRTMMINICAIETILRLTHLVRINSIMLANYGKTRLVAVRC